MNLFNVSERQFNKILERQGKEVTDIETDEKKKVIYTRHRSNGASESIIISYPKEYGWHKGTIISYGTEYYLLVNTNYIESDVFLTSVAMKCNAIWNLPGGPYYLVSGNLSSPAPNGSTIKSESGSISLYTNKEGMVEIGGVVNDFGGYWECINYFYIDKICYYYFQRNTSYSASSLSLTRNSNTTNYRIGVAADASCSLQYINSSTGATYYDTTATYTYTVSDTDLAVIDSDGILTGKALGTITVTCTAITSEGVTYTNNYSVTIVDANKEITIECNGTGNKITAGYSRTITVTYKKDDILVTETPTWTITGGAYTAGYISSERGSSYNQLRITCSSEGSAYAGGTIKVTATYADGTSAFIDITIKA